ncbi:MAG: hypothetical protein V2A69_05805 [Pseudomonadota bacterium]
MKKQTGLKATNVILFILALCQVTTGLAHELFDEELFEKIHPPIGLLLAIAVTVHVILNWGWIKTAYFKKP